MSACTVCMMEPRTARAAPPGFICITTWLNACSGLTRGWLDEGGQGGRQGDRWRAEQSGVDVGGGGSAAARDLPDGQGSLKEQHRTQGASGTNELRHAGRDSPAGAVGPSTDSRHMEGGAGHRVETFLDTVSTGAAPHGGGVGGEQAPQVDEPAPEPLVLTLSNLSISIGTPPPFALRSMDGCRPFLPFVISLSLPPSISLSHTLIRSAEPLALILSNRSLWRLLGHFAQKAGVVAWALVRRSSTFG